ncbi:MAG TPA: LLM class flavin-dependent oxidoreductase [Candidatus Acidoferrales bacterium]|jgi:luciferase family oxidoreductase group 1|nr:LLM class flavin-dependent oxidoreductase [Candidatus Acidoferrales bacterium]
MIKLSVLDQSPVSDGFTPADALRNTIELARLAERLGYERYWIAEHHAIVTLASPAPEILVARLGAETSKIRIGSGGVLLPHYSPLKVAENFRMLHAMYPDRIDLGIGRAPGGSGLEAFALRRDRGDRIQNDDFEEQLLELLAFLHHDFPAEHPFARIKVSPEMPGAPEVWLLGSSRWSSAVAAKWGLPYAFAHFISPEETSTALEVYRSRFQPSKRLGQPRAIVALGVICADTEAEAKRLFVSTELHIRRIRLQGKRLPVPTPEQAIAELGNVAFEADFVVRGTGEWPRYVVGAPEQVRDELQRMAGNLQLEEMMMIAVLHDHQARLRSYQLVAEAMNIPSRL